MYITCLHTCIVCLHICVVCLHFLYFHALQLGLHWRLSKQRCDSSSMMEYVSIFLCFTLNNYCSLTWHSRGRWRCFCIKHNDLDPLNIPAVYESLKFLPSKFKVMTQPGKTLLGNWTISYKQEARHSMEKCTFHHFWKSFQSFFPLCHFYLIIYSLWHGFIYLYMISFE